MALSFKDRKVQLIVAGAVAALLIGFLLVKMLGGGDGTAAPPTTPAGGITLQPQPTPSPSPSPTTVLVFSGRDPFQNLFGSQGGGNPPPSNPGGSSSPPPSNPGGSSSPPPSGSTSPPPTGEGGHGSSIVIGGHSVLLDDVFIAQGGIRKAQVEVDGTVYTVAAGESFDDNFKLVSFPSGSCANFVFGDEGFTLCENGGK